MCWNGAIALCQFSQLRSAEVRAWNLQGDTTKLKEYMKTLNLLPHKRKRKDAMLVKSLMRSPRLSPRSCLTGAAPLHLQFRQMPQPQQIKWSIRCAKSHAAADMQLCALAPISTPIPLKAVIGPALFAQCGSHTL